MILLLQGTKEKKRGRPLFLWDGDCGFCRRSVVWLRRHDRFHSLDFCPYQEADLSPELKAACENALHVIKPDGSIMHGGRAALYGLRFTRWHQIARILEWPIFLPFVEIGYKIIAANRMLFSKFIFARE